MPPPVLDGVTTVDGILGFDISSECTPVGCDGARERVVCEIIWDLECGHSIST